MEVWRRLGQPSNQTLDRKLPSFDCAGCKDFRFAIGKSYSSTATVIRSNGAAGCQTCQILCRVLQHYDPHWLEYEENEDTDFAVKVIFYPTPSVFRLCVDGKGEDVGDARSLDVYTTPDRKAPWPFIGVAAHLSEDISHIARLNNAKRWLDNCRASHDCSPDENEMPTRVLDLQDGDALKEVKLLHTNGRRDKWVCLSHCWGKQQPLRTTTLNIDRHLNRIPMAEMPPTFADAILVTRVLGLRYLWIDSLCIIQDDPKDWKTEAYNMAATYALAELTLSASYGTDCYSGLFHWPSRKPFAEFSTHDERSPPYSFFVRPSISHHEFAIGSNRYRGIHKLKTRAWTFQEHLLSPRVLQFGCSEMLWECHQSFECECKAGLQPDCVNGTAENLQIKSWFVQAMASGRRRIADFQDFYYELIEQYSQKQITFESDRLVAFEGIANIIAMVVETQHCAGHFELDLMHSLLWTNAYRLTYDHQHSDENIPSWSWASAGGHVVFPWKKELQGILYCQIQNTGFTEGRKTIDVEGCFLPAQLTLHRRLFGQNPRSNDEEILTNFGMPVKPVTEVVVQRNGCTIPVYRDYVRDRHGNNTLTSLDTTVLCLIVGLRGSGLLMLVLKRVGNTDEEPVYERIGSTGGYGPDSVPFFDGSYSSEVDLDLLREHIKILRIV